MLPLKPPCTSFTKCCTFWDMETFLHPHPIFSALPKSTFWPQEPKNSNLTNSFLEHYPQPKMNHKSLKDPKLILFLTIKMLYTYFWKMLPVGAWIWLALIWLMWAQITQPTSNHLKCARFSAFFSFSLETIVFWLLRTQAKNNRIRFSQTRSTKQQLKLPILFPKCIALFSSTNTPFPSHVQWNHKHSTRT